LRLCSQVRSLERTQRSDFGSHGCGR
jgi:hypothetical protein